MKQTTKKEKLKLWICSIALRGAIYSDAECPGNLSSSEELLEAIARHSIWSEQLPNVKFFSSFLHSL